MLIYEENRCNINQMQIGKTTLCSIYEYKKAILKVELQDYS